MYLLSDTDIVTFVSRAESIVELLFAVLELSLDEGWWGGAKGLFRAG